MMPYLSLFRITKTCQTCANKPLINKVAFTSTTEVEVIRLLWRNPLCFTFLLSYTFFILSNFLRVASCSPERLRQRPPSRIFQTQNECVYTVALEYSYKDHQKYNYTRENSHVWGTVESGSCCPASSRENEEAS